MSDFIDQFEEWVGETECPPVYFKYAAMSLVAGCLSMRTLITKRFGNQILPIYPNLYTLMLGPSSNGKSIAISRALSLLRRADYNDIINLYAGKMTAPGMYEQMSVAAQPWRSLIYCVMDELANDIGIGEYADQFVKSLTRMYFGESFDEHTVTRGHNKVNAPYCVNWVGCTTREWLADCLRREAMLGGFFGRLVICEAGYPNKRVVPSTAAIPQSWYRLDMHMVAEVDRILRMEGEFTRTEEAQRLELEWYEAQPIYPEGHPLAPTQRRGYDLLLKYEQNFSASESASMKVTKQHVEKAIKQVAETSRTIPELADFITRPKRYLVYRELERELSKRGKMTKADLARIAHEKGVMADELGRLLGTWAEAGMTMLSKDGLELTWV